MKMTVSELKEILTKIEEHYPGGGDCIVLMEQADDNFYDGQDITGWRYSEELYEEKEKKYLFLLRE